MARILLVPDLHNCFEELAQDLGVNYPLETVAECSCKNLFTLRHDPSAGGNHWSRYNVTNERRRMLYAKAELSRRGTAA